MSDDSSIIVNTRDSKRCRDQHKIGASTYEKAKLQKPISVQLCLFYNTICNIYSSVSECPSNPVSNSGHWRNNCPMEENSENEA